MDAGARPQSAAAAVTGMRGWTNGFASSGRGQGGPVARDGMAKQAWLAGAVGVRRKERSTRHDGMTMLGGRLALTPETRRAEPAATRRCAARQARQVQISRWWRRRYPSLWPGSPTRRSLPGLRPIRRDPPLSPKSPADARLPRAVPMLWAIFHSLLSRELRVFLVAEDLSELVRSASAAAMPRQRSAKSRSTARTSAVVAFRASRSHSSARSR